MVISRLLHVWHGTRKILLYMKMQIAKLLIKEDIVSIEQIKEAIEKKCNTDMGFSEALIEPGHISQAEAILRI